ncbi:5'-nucleotidase C-terminal domain-containing protein [Limibacter armeniacum]|uniref:5'-nucleotidase C-terminal domain-containing protein n=1 Tax=Limibacter armeniacum TaxID=466084 RepID=UPI002FE653DC
MMNTRYTYKLLTLVFLSIACSPVLHKVRSDSKTMAIQQQMQADNELMEVVTTYKQELDKEMNEVISFATMDLTKDDGALGNLVCIACEEALQKYKNVKADICLMNTGGLRAPIYQGAVTKGDVFELMPFDNSLVLITLSGDRIQELVDFLAIKEQPISGLEMTVRNNEIETVTINSQPFDRNKSYTVLTSDYLFGGGDNMVFLKDPEESEFLNILVRDAIMEYCVQHDSIAVAKENGVIFLKEVTTD